MRINLIQCNFIYTARLTMDICHKAAVQESGYMSYVNLHALEQTCDSQLEVLPELPEQKMHQHLLSNQDGEFSSAVV